MTAKPEGPAQEPQVFQRGNSWFVRWPSKASVCCGSEREARAIAREDWAELERINAGSEPSKPNNGLSFQEYEQTPTVPATPAPSQPAGAREWRLVHRSPEVLAAFPRVGTMALESSDGYAVPFDDAELVEMAKGHLQIVPLDAAKQTAAKDAEIERLKVSLELAEEEAEEAMENLSEFAESDDDGLLRLAENAFSEHKAAVERAVAAERERDSLRAENAALKAGKEGKL